MRFNILFVLSLALNSICIGQNVTTYSSILDISIATDSCVKTQFKGTIKNDSIGFTFEHNSDITDTLEFWTLIGNQKKNRVFYKEQLVNSGTNDTTFYSFSPYIKTDTIVVILCVMKKNEKFSHHPSQPRNDHRKECFYYDWSNKKAFLCGEQVKWLGCILPVRIVEDQKWSSYYTPTELVFRIIPGVPR